MFAHINQKCHIHISNRSLNHSLSNCTAPSDPTCTLLSKATSIVISRPFCCPKIAPAIGSCCFRIVRRAIVSEIVRMTRGWSWIAGLVSEGEVLASSGFEDAASAITLISTV